MKLPDAVLGRWLFSHEEGGARVYRPRDAAFAPSRRPRDGFDIEEDGTFRALIPGGGDAPTVAGGRWTLDGPERLVVAYDDGRTEVIEIVDAAPGALTVRRS